MSVADDQTMITLRGTAVHHLAQLFMTCEDLAAFKSPDFDDQVRPALVAICEALDADLTELQDIIDTETAWECGDCGRVYDRLDDECAACRKGLTK